ncbi:hypothetical protein RAS1_26060 [Phycisphaerae bacterium RAS1]|nr:hypothetical protein RAS1_26060 [Phycisphaerae bacterium RAS1]
MRRQHRLWFRLYASAAAAMALGGCVTDPQLLDFGRSTFAQVIADIFGQVSETLLRGSA